MKSGIYQISFSTGLFYIGKSVDIERRWEEHKKSFLEGKASAKMQSAYKQYGMPEFKIFLECHPDHLDILERFLIRHEHPTLNTVKGDTISVDDWVLLMNNSQLLQMSTVNLIKIIDMHNKGLEQMVRGLGKAKEEHDELIKKRTQEEINSDGYKRAMSELVAARAETTKYQRLYLESKKPWWKKLFK